MKTLLLHIPQLKLDKKEIMVMPMGLFSIADYLIKNGVDARILHYGIEKEINSDFNIVDFIKQNQYNIICLDLHWIKQMRQAIKTIKDIKKAIPKLKIITGGITATYFAHQLLKNIPEIDFVIRGEGELPLMNLFKAIEKRAEMEKVPNLSFRHKGAIHHNKVTFFTDNKFYEDICHSNFELLINFRYYLNRLLYADFDTTKESGLRDSYRNAFYYNPGKGCPYNCIYCGSHFYKKKYLYHKRGFYFFSLNKAESDIKNALKYGIDTLRISFDPDPARIYYHKLFERLRGYNIRLIFDCFSLPDEKFVRAVSRTFREDSLIVISIETGSDQVRRKIKRPYFKNNQLINSLKVLSKYNVRFHIFISYGLPYERREDIKNTIRIIEEIKTYNNGGITICPIILDIGSQMYENPERYDIKLKKKDFFDWLKEEISDKRSYYSTSIMNECEINAFVDKLRSII